MTRWQKIKVEVIVDTPCEVKTKVLLETLAYILA